MLEKPSMRQQSKEQPKRAKTAMQQNETKKSETVREIERYPRLQTRENTAQKQDSDGEQDNEAQFIQTRIKRPNRKDQEN